MFTVEHHLCRCFVPVNRLVLGGLISAFGLVISGVILKINHRAEIIVESPQEYQLFQRDGLNQADIPILFRLDNDGRQYRVLVRWNGGPWREIQARRIAGGVMEAVLKGQPAGQGDFEFKIPELGLTEVVKYVGVGDLFVIAGQSNAVGYFRQQHLYPRDEKIIGCAYDFGTKSWKMADDPINYFHRETNRGSVWPLVAAKLVKQTGGVPIGLADFSIVGTRMKAAGPLVTDLPGADWQPEHGCYQNLVEGICAATNHTNRFKAILFFGGESDALVGVSKEQFKIELKRFANSLQSDLGVNIRIIIAQIGDIYPEDSAVRDFVTGIQLAQQEIVDQEVFFAGPIGKLLWLGDAGDKIHFVSEESANQLARMWVKSILAMDLSVEG